MLYYLFIYLTYSACPHQTKDTLIKFICIWWTPAPLLAAMIDINESDKTTMTTIYLRSGPLIFIHIYHLHSTSTQVLSELNDIDQKNISLYTSTLVLRQSLEIRNYPPSLPVNTWHEAQLATCSPDLHFCPGLTETRRRFRNLLVESAYKFFHTC